jgi:hypothetical protein
MFKFNYLEIIGILNETLLRFSINFLAFSVFHKKHIFPTVRKFNKKKCRNDIKKITNTQLDASSSPLSNGENRSSLSCFCQTLFKKYSRAFMFAVRGTRLSAKETDLIEILSF